ncbi:uncharacterized protein LOC105440948 [Strongylocentrotus purpuratus]|uniref:Uncharacterized protein n=1 Tax=Strongylocentrotus purpuratus TaxID=7668 RepID=A0A7M7HI02_STRPU|nr:uncharacterized protein LOC105440948 [Strongylocentrotus purpuratus]
MKCCMHVVCAPQQSNLTAFSLCSWVKFRECAERWKRLSSGYSDKAKKFWSALDLAENQTLNKFNDIKLRYGYHRKCYQRFTDVSLLTAAETLLQQQQASSSTSAQSLQSSSRDEEEGDQQEATEEPPAKRLQVPELPRECCLCHSNRYCRERLSGKRMRERLVACQKLETSSLLKKAAKMTGNRALFLQIQGKDLVASKAHYHATCYREATRIFRKRPREEENPEEAAYHISYEVFCRDVIDGRIIDKKEILRMTTLSVMFVQCVQKNQGLDASSYRPDTLKKRLRKSYPQLQFVKAYLSLESELVMVHTIPVPDIKDSSKVQEIFTSSESEDMDTENETNLSATPSAHKLHVGDMYFTARSLREECMAVDASQTWPPTGRDLSLNVARDKVPVRIYNFIAWMIGASDEPVGDRRVNVLDHFDRRILSLAQDIICATKQAKKHLP